MNSTYYPDKIFELFNKIIDSNFILELLLKKVIPEIFLTCKLRIKHIRE